MWVGQWGGALSGALPLEKDMTLMPAWQGGCYGNTTTQSPKGQAHQKSSPADERQRGDEMINKRRMEMEVGGVGVSIRAGVQRTHFIMGRCHASRCCRYMLHIPLSAPIDILWSPATDRSGVGLKLLFITKSKGLYQSERRRAWNTRLI